MKAKVFLVAVAVALLVTTRPILPPTLAAPQLQTIIVTSTADSGPGSLREALSLTPSGTVITFDPTVFPPDNPSRISLLSPLPALSQGQVTIDASNAGVLLDGGQLPPEEGANGFTIASSGNTIQGLQILGFPEHGITLQSGAQDNTIGGDRTVGLGPTGQGNVISGNGIEGVRIEGPGTDDNLVIGNLIGTDATGTSALGNGFHGVAIVGGAQYNQVGAATADKRNIISGNAWDGVFIHYSGTMFNTVSGNHIGTDASGTTPIPNGNFGVNLGDNARDNLVGGGTPAEGNLISGNHGGGVNVAGDGVRDNIVSSNLIGVDALGNQPLPNTNGVVVGGGASYNTVRGNVVSGNLDGVIVAGSGTTNNIVHGNSIGTNAEGDAAISNEIDGVWIGDGAHHNVVGGTTPEERNIISGNLNNGVVIDASAHNTVSGNYIGTDATGTAAVGNGNIGVVLAWGAQHNLVGGATPEQRNIISGNGNVGVSLANGDTMGNIVTGNYIGTDVTGTVSLGNAEAGVWIGEGAQHNIVGGTSPGEGNLISGNGGIGVRIDGSDTLGNAVAGSFIGTDFNGSDPLGNVGDGVSVHAGAGLNTIGPGNTIAFNGENGVSVQGAGTLGNTITANSIHNNDELGIRNWQRGNTELSPPTITHAGTRVVWGTAPPNTRVEIFSDEGAEGRLFEGATEADQLGHFVFQMPQGRFTGPNVTASCIDAEGNTSSFSSPQSPPAPAVMRELPNIIAPTQVSVDPRVVGTNLALALSCVLFFGLTSSIFNTILKDYSDELRGAAGRLVPRILAGFTSRLGGWTQGLTQRGRSRIVLMWVGVLLATSLIESFLDPTIGLLSLERLGLLVTLFLSAVAVSGLELGSDLFAHRRWAPTLMTESKVQWLGMAIALGCVILSRALGFTPGYLYGIVGAMYVVPSLVGTAESGKRAALVLLAVLTGGLVLWLATAFLPSALAELEPLLLTAFLIGLQGVFFALIPLAFTDGGHIWNWRKGVWFVFFTVVLFCFYHFVLNPSASDVQAVQQNSVQTLLALVVTFGLATLTLWMLFPFRLGRARARGG